MGDYRYHLEEYKGKATRHKCPKCGDSQSFTYYVDNCGRMAGEDFGVCNHRISCGYSKYPDFQNEGLQHDDDLKVNNKDIKQKDMLTFSFGLVEKSASFKSNFVEFLCRLFEVEEMESVLEDYAIGATKRKEVIFWQIDSDGIVRAGKVMQYNPIDGHRKKVTWIHSLMEQSGKLASDWRETKELRQCYFGEHLLKVYPYKDVAIVESEKSAILGSIVFPNYNWLACGSLQQLIKKDTANLFSDKNVVLFPDTDLEGVAYHNWVEKSKLLHCKSLEVSDLLEIRATSEEKIKKIDIGDWIIETLLSKSYTEQIDDKEDAICLSIIDLMGAKNKALYRLVETFDLVAV